MDPITRIERLRRLYQLRKHRNRPRFFAIPESAIPEFTRQVEKLTFPAGHWPMPEAIYEVSPPDAEWAMRKMLESGHVFLAGMQGRIGPVYAVGSLL